MSSESGDMPLGNEEKFASVGCCKSTKKDVVICYQTHGNPSDPCLLLVRGLKSSLMANPIDFINYFLERHYFVISYDNRDVGRSTYFTGEKATPLLLFGLPQWSFLPYKIPYTLNDMMEDGIGLLDVLKIDKAHVFGLSMGGMIVQLMAIHHPKRVLSLNIFCSHVGGADMVHPSMLTYLQLLHSPKSDQPDDMAEYLIEFIKFLSKGQYREDIDTLHEAFRHYYMRNTNNGDDSRQRQISAVMTAPSRLNALKKVRCPTVVMHGAQDPLIPVTNAHILAQAIPTSKLVIYPKLGHDFPPALYRELANQIIVNMSYGDDVKQPYTL